MNAAEYLIKKLEELGITEFFGVPGDYNFNVLYAIRDNSNTNWIGCTNELNAGYAADGYAREKGYGAIVTTYGVGELSAINAIAGSYSENVPVVNIVGVPRNSDFKNSLQVHHSISGKSINVFEDTYKSVTQTTAFLNNDNAKVEIDRVIQVLVKYKKPVYIAIPEDVALIEIDDKDVDYGWLSDTDNLNLVVDKISERLANSSKPLIMADCLISRFDALYEFKQFVEKSGLPLTNLVMGTGIVDNGYKNYLGPYLDEEDNPIAHKYVDETDCLISIGCIYSDLNTDGNVVPFDVNSHIAIYGTYTYINNKKFNNVKMSDVLEALSEKIQTRTFETEIPKLGYDTVEVSKEKISSDYLYPRIQEFLKENDIIVADVGTVTNGLAKIKFPPNIKLYVQNLWSAIGWATPAALGLGFAKPDSRLILITGDGAHQATAIELASIIRYGFKPVVIVINNNGYTFNRLLCDDINENFNNVANINYSKLCRSLGGDIWSASVENDDSFDKALKVTQIMDKLCYIEVRTETMDVTVSTKRYASKSKSKSVDTNAVHDESAEQTENKRTVHYSGFEYETTVHESLKIEDLEEE